ncbi:MAG: hypothetical protein WBJ68_03780 [Candidatus Dechloromonas phosphoritropha]
MSCPFDEARYLGLLKGLEISEIQLSALERTSRFDSEFFLKSHLAVSKRLAQLPKNTVAALTAISDGNHFAISDEFVESGIPYYRGQDVVGNFFIEQATPTHITETAFRQPLMARSHLKQGDVLLSIIGTIGEASLVSSKTDATCSCKLAILRPKKINPAFLASFLRSTFGRSQIVRYTRGAVQMGLLLEDMDQILVPSTSDAFQLAIGNCVLAAQTFLNNAQSELKQGETTLLRGLNLETWQPPNPLSYTRSSADAFTAGRFDAEYFYPAKASAQAHLNAFPGKTIGSMFNSVRELWQPENAPANQPVRNYDLNDALSPFLDDAKEPSYPTEIASTKKRIQKGDIVVSRLRSYLKEIAVVQADSKEPLVGSTEFIVLRPKAGALPVEALLVFLRSTLPQLIFQWSQDGSNHPRFDEKELLNLHVPDAVSAIGKELTDSVNAATSARQRAKELLEAAKRAVEIAIEDSETAALAYLAEFS